MASDLSDHQALFLVKFDLLKHIGAYEKAARGEWPVIDQQEYEVDGDSCRQDEQAHGLGEGLVDVDHCDCQKQQHCKDHNCDPLYAYNRTANVLGPLWVKSSMCSAARDIRLGNKRT